MLQTLWFFIEIAVLVAGCVWLISQPGSINIDLAGYNIDISAGLFFIMLAALVLTFYVVMRIVRGIFSVPKVISKYHEADQRKKSFRALTRGLVAVAAGDVKQATKYSKLTKHLWPDMTGLPLLLEAQAARLRGEDGLAQNKFENLLEDKDAAFLGVKGLLRSALDSHDFERALEFARQAEKKHPKKSWIVNIVYDLEIKNRLWQDALRTNHKISKIDALPDEKILHDRVAIHLHQNRIAKRDGALKRARQELKIAYKIDPDFTPAAIRKARDFITLNQNKKAAIVVEKAWRHMPHPELATIWDNLAPVGKGKKPEKDRAKISAWYEKLISFNPDDIEGYIAAAQAAMNMDLWGEAKAYLTVAEKLYPSARVFRMQAIVEQNSTHNEDAIHTLMERAAEAMPDKVWVCAESGQFYDEWTAIAKPHGSFNTIIWDYAGARIVQSSWNRHLLSANDETALLIDPAA